MPNYRDELDKLAEEVREDLDGTIRTYERFKEFIKLFEKGDITESRALIEQNRFIGTAIVLSKTSARLLLELKKEVDKLRMR